MHGRTCLGSLSVCMLAILGIESSLSSCLVLLWACPLDLVETLFLHREPMRCKFRSCHDVSICLSCWWRHKFSEWTSFTLYGSVALGRISTTSFMYALCDSTDLCVAWAGLMTSASLLYWEEMLGFSAALPFSGPVLWILLTFLPPFFCTESPWVPWHAWRSCQALTSCRYLKYLHDDMKWTRSTFGGRVDSGRNSTIRSMYYSVSLTAQQALTFVLACPGVSLWGAATLTWQSTSTDRVARTLCSTEQSCQGLRKAPTAMEAAHWESLHRWIKIGGAVYKQPHAYGPMTRNSPLQFQEKSLAPHEAAPWVISGSQRSHNWQQVN